MSLPSSTIEITWPMPGAGNRIIVSCILPLFFFSCVYFRSSSTSTTLNPHRQCLKTMRVLLLSLKRGIGPAVVPMWRAHPSYHMSETKVFNNFLNSLLLREEAREDMRNIVYAFEN